MFKFGFSINDSSHTDSSSGPDKPNLDPQGLPSKEVFVSVEEELEPKYSEADIDSIALGSDKLLFIKPSTLLNVINNEKTALNENVLLAEKNHSDLIPFKYEGGFKIWECTYDIARFLEPCQVTDKTVLDLGCGTGLLGILALKLGAETVHFQDYNDDVLQYSTIPNVRLNSDSCVKSKCQFFSGDWSSFADVSQSQYDLIVSSETIYNPVNYTKLHDCLQRILKPSGTILLGAKSYYFGVGGSTRQFEQLFRARDVFDIEVVWKCTEGVQREILLLKFKTKN